MSELNNQGYRISETDVPWAKPLSNRGDILPLPRGVQAVIPNPQGEGYLYLSHDQYVEALGRLGRLAYDPDENVQQLPSGISQEEREAWAEVTGQPPYALGFVGLREQVAMNPVARIVLPVAANPRHIADLEGEQ